MGFDKMRTDMMAKSKEFWDNCNKDMGMAPFRPQLPSWAMPDSVKDKWMPMMTKANDEVIKVKDDDTKFEVTLDVSEYRPEELKVTTVNNTLAIEENGRFLQIVILMRLHLISAQMVF